MEVDLVKWEIMDEDELKTRVEENTLVEGARLFKIEKEVPIHFERITHLDIWYFGWGFVLIEFDE